MQTVFFLLLVFFAGSSQAQISTPAAFKRFNHILFRDDFGKDSIGRFPSHWLLGKDNLVNALDGHYERDYNKRNESGIKVALDENNEERYVTSDAVARSSFLPVVDYGTCSGDSLSFECDFRIQNDRGMVDFIFYSKEHNFLIFNLIHCDGTFEIAIGDKTGYVFEQNGKPRKIKGVCSEGYNNRAWHHFSANMVNHVVTCYIDQYKAATFTEIPFSKFKFIVSAENDHKSKVHCKNFLITGGFCYPFQNILTQNKFVTYAVHFDVNKSLIKPESTDFVDQLAAWLTQNPTIKLQIDGHTDSDGDSVANIKISQARADEVKKQLAVRGIADNRLATKGYGATNPIKPNTTGVGKAENRRVEFIKK